MEYAVPKNKVHLTVLVEVVVSAGLGVYFHWVLHWQQEAYVVLATGMLLTLATYLLSEEIASSRDQVLAHYKGSHSQLTALSLIDDRECQEHAPGLLASTERTLKLLQEGYVPLDEPEFYLAGAEELGLRGLRRPNRHRACRPGRQPLRTQDSARIRGDALPEAIRDRRSQRPRGDRARRPGSAGGYPVRRVRRAAGYRERAGLAVVVGIVRKT